MNRQNLLEYANVRFPVECRAILDVTKPPYSLDNTGNKDCTGTLRKIIDHYLQLQIEGIEATRQRLQNNDASECILAFENIKRDHVISQIVFPDEEPFAPILYFPNGTYLVSDTISYTLDNLYNFVPHQSVPGLELCRQIMMIGQSREGTIIKLKDHCPGFEYGNKKPVISYIQGEFTNVAWSNYFENITIDVGIGNPGAVGLVHYGNNSGAVRNVTIRSSDPEGRGAIGLAVLHEIISGCCVRNVSVEGFDVGIKVSPTRNFVAMADLDLHGQRKAGIKVEQTIASFHNVHIKCSVPAFHISGALANVVLTDAELISPVKTIYPAFRIELGCVLVRNLQTRGFAESINIYWGEKTLPDGYVDEFCTHPIYSPFGDALRSLQIPCPEFPDREGLWTLENWHCVNDYGAVGDGITDDTAAIQAAMNSGGTIWFQPGCYLLSETIIIPETVRHIHFMCCDLAIPEHRRDAPGDAIFSVIGNCADPLLMEKLNGRHHLAGSIRLVHHAGTRILHMRDVHTQCNPSYFNTVPGGTVFLEDVVCTTAIRKYREQPCFHFVGQTVYAHHMNPERSAHEIINDGGTLWLMGFKTEGDGPLCETINGGRTDILGGTISIGTNGLRPILYNENSDVSASLTTNGYGSQNIFPIAVEEIREGNRRLILHNELPHRFDPFYRLPLYVGRGKKKDGEQQQIHHDALY